jgi:penicillin G amidase
MRSRRSLTRPRPAGRLAGLLLLAGLVWAGVRGAGALPPLGPLVDPVRGAWGLAASADLPPHDAAEVPGLDAGVRVVYDDRAVPHIFARSELDAWRALGYVTARDRLFQLDLQARAGGGTLSGLLGPQALPLDRVARRLGMARAADRLLASLPDTGEALASMKAYASGVNAYIDAMPAGELPLEYRLLDRRPARWRPVRTIQVLLRMNYTLGRSTTELDYLRAAAAVGDTAAAALFPQHWPIQEPIQPSPGEPRRIPLVVPPPGRPDSAAAALVAAAPIAPAQTNGDPGPGLGSNNWAVAPSRTRERAALLAGDPHLDLTLPSIWYEAHLVVPGTLDVYGVTIPGLPAVVIGFNRDVAWTFTNSEADLMDYWAEAVDDSLQPTRYRLDGVWVPLQRRIEIYRGPHGETLAADTVYFTHRGPMQRVGARWLSMRWTALEGAGETAGFHRAARARSAREWLQAMAGYRSPPQNMLVADRAGTIALRTTGRFPIRPGDGRGDRVHDGTTRASDWTGDWPVGSLPQAIAPAQGYLASANQEPLDPRDQPRYLGADWPPPWRALRINQLLRGDSAVTAETMRQWQTDPGSARADWYVPYFLRAAAAFPGDTALSRGAELLAAWDHRYTTESDGPVLFEAAMRLASAKLWDELPAEVTPSAAAFVALLDDPTNPWWDDRGTPAVERRDDVLAQALAEGYRSTLREYGPPELLGWGWSRVHRIDIWHLLRIPALSARGIAVSGGPATLSPSSMTGGGEGASWRMVVELGPELRAWGTYPGGQSGNPASWRYDDRIPLWTRGELSALRFPRRADAVAPTSVLLLRRPP